MDTSGSCKFDRTLGRLGARVAKEDRIQMRRQFFQQRLREQSAEQRAIHLHHVRQIHLQHITDGLLHRGVVAPDIEDAVAAEKIEIVVPVEIDEVAPVRMRIHLVEPDDPLDGDQRGIQVLLVELVVFAEASGDEVLKVERHRGRTLRR
jgi:methyl coenzyme M reductase subunit C